MTYSVDGLTTLARDASASTTYKPALLKALVAVAPRATEVVPLAELGREFVRLYWMQTVVFRLRQAPTLKKEPEVLRSIREAAERHRTRELLELPRDARVRLDALVSRTLKINVLEAFHRSAPTSMPPLFRWRRGEPALELPDGARAFLIANQRAIETLANLWWARKLERWNLLTPLVIEKVEHGRPLRTSLARYVAVLERTDGARCFYCDRRFEPVVRAHVDHFVPWSFVLTNQLWNLVLACASCNLSKSDTLPEARYLEKLARVTAARDVSTLPAGVSALIESTDVRRLYDAALDVEWPTGWHPARPSSSMERVHP